ncbi:MAG: type I secretion system permease/ATPase, partial [Rhodoplanes sp.]
LKAHGAVIILITHRPAALAHCNKVLYLDSGAQQAFGPREEVLRKALARPVKPAVSGADLRVVTEREGAP